MTNPSTEPNASVAPTPSDFIRDIVAQHVAEGKYPRIHTRFPPEPNGYLHIGHAKSICLNFGIAREFGGVCNLRMDDTNPTKEEVEYVESIQADVNWLISGWADDKLGLKEKGKTPETITSNGKPDFHLAPKLKSELQNPKSEILEPFYASDYFAQIYEYGVKLIQKGKAYVCHLSAADTDAYRGAPDRPGKDSPFRTRSIAENLDLFTRMKNGEFPDGACTLRAKIDMASSNVWLRDPLLYRIRHAAHHHTGDAWCIYPMYDFAHCLSDYIEGITHSICTLEFEVHRPLYDWILENLDLPRPLPHQYEFAKLIPSYMIVSKRKLIQLVNDQVVSGWDDPRLPTISGIRRRGVTADALRKFAYNIGVTKYVSVTDIAVYEHAVRDDLNQRALRRLAVLRPLKVVITNFPEGKTEELDAINNPEDENAGKRKLPFSRELYIERDDFAENPAKKWFRLAPGQEVRLRYACIVRCTEVVKDAAGEVVELRCTWDPESRGGNAADGRKIKGTIHWVSATHALGAEVRLYDRLFRVENPLADKDVDWKSHINPSSLEIVSGAKIERSLASASPLERFQFERIGYFCVDEESSAGKLVFNRTISLKDSWSAQASKG